MVPRLRFLSAVGGGVVERPAVASATSVATTEAMERCGAAFPDAHRDPALMARLAAFATVEAGYGGIMPLFSVVTESAALGAKVDWGQFDIMPSIIEPLWREPEDVSLPDEFERRESMAVALEALRRLRADYPHLAIIGKTFGPWSLSFHLFGVENVLVMTLEEPEKLKRIFAGVMEISVRSALAQIRAGADALCLGDHCSRDMCSPATYREFLFPLHQAFARRVPCPVILHACGETSDRIDAFADSTLSCFHYDTRVPAKTAARLAGGKIALMGGVSNIESLLPGDEGRIAADVRSAMAAGVNVIGPECAVPLNTGMRSLKAVTEAVIG
ncbi:MAG: uroporphyrinogen decarboxylase family protein [Armatimonadota bacterium]